MPITLNGTTGITTPSIDASAGNSALTTLSVGGNNISAVNSLGFRNRIINGDMRIDQRNAGASVTNTTNSVFPVDRFFIYGAVSSKFTAQQNSASVTPPAGFTNYLGCVSSSAYTVGSGESFSIYHNVEGFNLADFAWGTANAQSATLSFWTRSSLTGTFSVTLRNSAQNRSYPATYTINAANTWEYKTIIIPGETTGTWVTNSGIGVSLIFNLGTGAAASTTANAWASANFVAATGAVSVVGTNGATFYITGVQLEAGSVATPFERRDYGRELMMCQRYYEKSYEPGTVPGTSSSSTSLAFVYPSSSQTVGAAVYFKVSKRATPTVTSYDQTGNSGKVTLINNGHNFTATQNAVSTESWSVQGPNGQSNGGIAFHYVAAIEL